MNAPNGNNKKKDKRGILRLDINKPRSSSGGSVEFRSQPELLGQVKKISIFYLILLSLNKVMCI